MLISFDSWKLVAGIAFFLLGMNFLEEALQKMAGRPFKLFLKKQTSNKIKAVTGGVIVTGILQSSSIVNLLTLAFVGAGVIKMQNALAVILGANLGTTLNSWIVATIGFNINIENFALPVLGISGIVMLLTSKEGRWYTISKFLFGFGFLFVGLGYMKTGMESLVKQIDLGALVHYPLILFLLVGLLITSLIQSGSATVAIVLSALHANAITLLPATAVILGSEVGTTLKLVLASVNGLAVKKQVAVGNLFFNIVSIIPIFIFLQPVNYFITEIISIKDNLIALVFFQTLINLMGILIFLPFLNKIGKFLEKHFSSKENDTLFIHNVKVEETDMAMAALEKETKQFIYYVSEFVQTAFNRHLPFLNKLPLNKEFTMRTIMDKYEYIKHLHGEINTYSISLGTHITDQQTTARLEQLTTASRNAMYAAKNIKDAFPDIDQLRNSSNNIKYDFYKHAGVKAADFYQHLWELVLSDKPSSYFDALNEIYMGMQREYTRSLKKLYKEAAEKKVNEIEFSTLLNFNREMYASFKSIVFAVKDYLLDTTSAAHFDELPGFVR